MSQRRETVSSIARFLGEGAESGGPFGLLGLPADEVPQGVVIAARERQLRRIDAHPEAITPQADEVRLAVHAATAQLLNPVVRQHLLQRWKGQIAPARGAGPAAGSEADKKASPGRATPQAGGVRGAPHARGGDGAAGPASSASSAPASRIAPASSVAAPSAPRSVPAASRQHPPGARQAAQPFTGQAPSVLVGDAVLAIGAAGGWNTRALRRLAYIAYSRGFGVGEVVAAVETLARRPGAVAAVGPGASPAATDSLAASGAAAAVRSGSAEGAAAPRGAGVAGASRGEATQARPASGRSQRAMLAGALSAGVATIALAATGFVILSRGGPAEPKQPADASRVVVDPSATSSGERTAREPAPPAPPPDPALAIGSATEVLALLEEAASQQELDAYAAIDRFGIAVRAFVRLWPELDIGQRRSVVNRVGDFVAAVGNDPDLGRAAITAVAAPATPLIEDSIRSASDLYASVGVAGLLQRLRQMERDFTGGVNQLVVQELSAVVGERGAEGGFEGGVAAGLERASASMTPQDSAGKPAPEAAWNAYINAARAALPDYADDALLRALETLLAADRDPTREPNTQAALRVLGGAIAWTTDDDARRWLLQQFGNQSVSTPMLAALSRTVSSVAPAMLPRDILLDPSANELERRQTRDAYAMALGLDARDGASDAAAIAAAAETTFVSTADPERDARVAMASAVRRASANVAFDLLWSGRGTDADAALDALRALDARLNRLVQTGDAPVGGAGSTAPAGNRLSPPAGAPGGPGGPTTQTHTAPGSRAPQQNTGKPWLVRYEEARGADDRAGLLRELAAFGTSMTRGEAGRLGEEAVSGPRRVQEAARDTLLLLSDRPVALQGFVNAMDELRGTEDARAFLQRLTGRSLPDPGSPEFASAARAAVVSMLLDALAADSDAAVFDRLGEALDEAYAARAGQSIVVSGAGPETAERSARAVLDRWTRISRATTGGRPPGLTASEVEGRRSARLRLARGVAQRFAVEQLAIAEMMAGVVAAEQPTRSADVLGVLDDLAAARRSAGSVYEQMLAGEEAISRLWSIRFGEVLQ